MARKEPEFTESSKRVFNRIRKGVNEGKSGRAIQRELREDGFNRDEKRGFGNAAFWRAHRKAKEFSARGQALQHSRLNFVPKKDSIPISPFVSFRNYQMIIEVEGTSIEGVPITKFVTVASNRPISRSAGIRDAEISIEADAERYGFDLDKKITYRVKELMRRDPKSKSGQLAAKRKPRRQ